MFLPVLEIQWIVNSAEGGIINDDGASLKWVIHCGSHCSYGRGRRAGSGIMGS